MAKRRSKPLPDSFPKQWPVYEELYGKLTDDEWAAHCFLAGYDQHFSADGRPIDGPETFPDPVYVKTSVLKGNYEAFGREALIRVLERALKTKRLFALVLLEDLIGLFDPKKYPHENRKLIFKFRSRKPHKSTKSRSIAHFIQEKMQTGEKWYRAVEFAQKAFGRNGQEAHRSIITDAWAADKKRHPNLHLPVRSDRRSSRTKQ
jgi:hypothetical protein